MALHKQPEEIRVADQILDTLTRAGVRRVFGIPGGAISPLFDALLDHDIELVTCQHETMAVYAASGYSRATGQPGVVMVTSGPGVLNAITGMTAAFHDEAPLVVLVGDVASTNGGRGALQDGGASGIDIVSVVRPLTKLAESLSQPYQVGAMIERALSVASSHPCGPALLRLPVDLTQRAIPSASVRLAPPTVIKADDDACAHLAAMLAQARRPALFLGVGARQARAGEAARALAEWTRCPVITDIEAKGVVPESHPLSLGIFGVGSRGPASRYLEEGVDLLVTVGARLDDTTTLGYSPMLRAAGTLVQVDHDARRLCRSYRPDLAVMGDLVDLLERVRSRIDVLPVQTLLERDRIMRELRQRVPAGSTVAMDGPPYDPRAVASALAEAFGADAVFTCDIGNHMLFAAQTLVIDSEDGFHVANGLGGMGSGIGTAIGLQLGYGSSRQVVSICGDGGVLMVGNELATCAKHRIPVVFAVYKDGHYGMVQHGDERVHGRSHRWTTPENDLVGYARSLGVDAIRVADPGDLTTAATRSPVAPLLLEIPINPQARGVNPREGTFTFPAVPQ